IWQGTGCGEQGAPNWELGSGHPQENWERLETAPSSQTGFALARHIGGFFCLSTLLPITPPRMPPTAAPIRPPFTLLRLVVAPITAPAAAPMAASRCVCLTTTSPLEAVVVVTVPALLEPLDVPL